MAYNLFILFLLVFCFPVVGPLNSAYIATGIALMKICFCDRVGLLARFYRNSYIKILIWSSLGMTVLCGGWTFLLGAKDYSLTAAFFSLTIGLLLAIIVLASLCYKNYDDDFYERLLVNIFVIQACISIAAFVSPSVKEFVHHFQFADQSELSEGYGGFRGLALSGRLFFEFAATCGLISFVQFKRIITRPSSSSFIEYIKLVLVVICGFFAGRTSMIGFGFGLLYLILYKNSIVNKFKIVGKVLSILVACLIVCVVVLPSEILDFITLHFFPWLFDLFIKYHDTGSTEDSASFNTLNEMYEYVNITSEEWVYGSGNYSSPYGGYYKSVDGGYIRQLLYWGVIGSIFSIVYSLIYFIRPYFQGTNRNDKLYIFLLLVYTFFVHYKGDLAPTSRFYHIPIVLIMLPYVFNPVKAVIRNKIYNYTR